MTLKNIIQDKSVKASIVADCTHLVDEQVTAKSGFSGMALKTAYRLIKGIGPSYIQGAIGRILPETFNALDPMWQEGVEAGDPVEYLIQNRSRTADLLLSVTDARMEGKPDGVLRSTYNKFRKSVKGDIEEAVPSFAKILGNHTQAMQQA